MSTIFNEDKNVEENKLDSQSSDTNVNNQFDDLLNGIKNDSGERKYNSVESALEALKHSQEFIPKIQGDNETLTQQVESLKSQNSKVDDLTEIVNRLSANKTETVNQPESNLNEQDVAKLVQQALAQNSAQASKESNIKSVTDTLSQNFGTDAEKQFYDKASELGMTNEAFNELAGTSPKAVLAFFGSTPKDLSLLKGSQGVDHNFTQPVNTGRVESPVKSIMAGATSKQLTDHFKQHTTSVYAKHNVQS